MRDSFGGSQASFFFNAFKTLLGGLCTPAISGELGAISSGVCQSIGGSGGGFRRSGTSTEKNKRGVGESRVEVRR